MDRLTKVEKEGLSNDEREGYAALKLTDERVTKILLLDCRNLLRSIRAMMLFFTVLSVIGLVVGVIAVFLQALVR